MSRVLRSASRRSTASPDKKMRRNDPDSTDTASDSDSGDVSDLSNFAPCSQPVPCSQPQPQPPASGIVTRVHSIVSYEGRPAVVVETGVPDGGVLGVQHALIENGAGNLWSDGTLTQSQELALACSTGFGNDSDFSSLLDTAMPSHTFSQLYRDIEDPQPVYDPRLSSQPRGSAEFDQQFQQTGYTVCQPVLEEFLFPPMASYLMGETMTSGPFSVGNGNNFAIAAPPRTSAANNMYAATEQATINTGPDDPGQFYFKLSVPSIKGKDWAFNKGQRKLFVKDDSLFDVVFSVTKECCRGMAVKITAIHHDQGMFGLVVTPCRDHASDGARYLSSTDPGVSYEGSTVVLRFDTASSHGAGKRSMTGHLKILCKNSDFKTKCVIKAHCELIDERGNVVGKQTLELRGCACPQRDARDPTPKSGSEEPGNSARPSPKKGSKRKRSSSSVAPGRSADASDFVDEAERSKEIGVRERAYTAEDGSLVYSLHARLPESYKRYLQMAHDAVKCAEFTHNVTMGLVGVGDAARSGFRTQFVQSAASEKSARRHRLEIQKWIDEVVECPVVSPSIFIANGFTTLDEIFRMKRPQINSLLADLSAEARGKFTTAIETRTSPALPVREDSETKPSFFSSQQ